MTSIKVGIADDHTVFVESLSKMLNTTPDLRVTITADDGNDLLNKCEIIGVPDVILLDLTMPGLDGFKTCEELLKRYNDISVIALTGHKEKNYIAKMIRSGASGYLLKNTKVEDVISAIKKAADGGLPFNNEAIQVMCNIYKVNEGRLVSKEDFTDRELEVIQLVCQEYSTNEIAAKLYLSESTISSHKKNIFRKMKVKNAIGLAIYAITHGIVD